MAKSKGGWFQKGRSDQEKKTFRPPDGTSWGKTIHRQLTGPTRPDKAYRRGHKSKR